MKTMTTAFLLVACLVSAQEVPEDLPGDVERLVRIRDQEVKTINQKFEAALHKIRKEYVDRADYEAIHKIDIILGERLDEIPKAEHPILGVWYFTKDGRMPARYVFYEGGTFVGAYPDSRRAYKGHWKAADAIGKKVLVYRSEEPELVFADIYLTSPEKARWAARGTGKTKMRGERPEEE